MGKKVETSQHVNRKCTWQQNLIKENTRVCVFVFRMHTIYAGVILAFSQVV
jgi:hypothetical protein